MKKKQELVNFKKENTWNNFNSISCNNNSIINTFSNSNKFYNRAKWDIYKSRKCKREI